MCFLDLINWYEIDIGTVFDPQERTVAEEKMKILLPKWIFW